MTERKGFAEELPITLPRVAVFLILLMVILAFLTTNALETVFTIRDIIADTFGIVFDFF